ncbi:hypothetical protein Ancab_007331 [Ancistrocladus abbreviatus]
MTRSSQLCVFQGLVRGCGAITFSDHHRERKCQAASSGVRRVSKTHDCQQTNEVVENPAICSGIGASGWTSRK